MSRRGLADLYNNLPSLEDANAKFVNRDDFFSKVAPLLAKYDRKFGVCLVHRHCLLEEGEVMVATGNITQPERNVECYPDRWTAEGEPYEFTRIVTEPLPPILLEEFQTLTKAHGVDVLGLFYVQPGSSDEVAVERTEGRKNILEYGNPVSSSVTTTNWVVSPHGALTMVGSCTCVTTLFGHIKPSDQVIREDISTDKRLDGTIRTTQTTSVIYTYVTPSKVAAPTTSLNAKGELVEITDTTVIFTSRGIVTTTVTNSRTDQGGDTVSKTRVTTAPVDASNESDDKVDTRKTTIIVRRLGSDHIDMTVTESKITTIEAEPGPNAIPGN